MTLKEVLTQAVTADCLNMCGLTLNPCPKCRGRVDSVWRVIGPIEQQIIEIRRLVRDRGDKLTRVRTLGYDGEFEWESVVPVSRLEEILAKGADRAADQA